jgi:hypothetical protein
LPLENLRLGVREDAIEAAQDGEWQDDVLILVALARVANEICDTPEEADDLAVVHSFTFLSLGPVGLQARVERHAGGHAFSHPRRGLSFPDISHVQRALRGYWFLSYLARVRDCGATIRLLHLAQMLG